jgi:glycosyltransferase involved in cell wall biosynthesis
MKISIITPVKNLEKYISETIESVLNQRGDFELEYIIMDGKSVDNTLRICEEYQRQIQSNTRQIFCNSIDIKIHSSLDNTMYEALSNGLQLASGDIISYINGDDFYLPNAFNCVNEIFSKFEQVKWLTGNISTYNPQGNIISFRIPWQYNSNLVLKGFYNALNLSIIQQESSFWRRECKDNIDYDKLKTYKLAGDYFLWHSFAKNGYQLFIVDTFLGGIRLRQGQLSANKLEYYKEYNQIKTKADLGDKLLSYMYWLVEQFSYVRIRQKFSKNRIRYKPRGWKVQ